MIRLYLECLLFNPFARPVCGLSYIHPVCFAASAVMPTGAVSISERVYIPTKDLQPAYSLAPSDLHRWVGNYAPHIWLAHSFYIIPFH